MMSKIANVIVNRSCDGDVQKKEESSKLKQKQNKSKAEHDLFTLTFSLRLVIVSHGNSHLCELL